MTQRTATFLQISLALAALLFLAAGIGNVQFSAGRELDLLGLLLRGMRFETPPAAAGVPEMIAFPPWARIVFWLVLLTALAYALVSPEGRRRLFMTLILVALVLFIAERYRDRLQEPPAEEFVSEGVGALPEAPLAPLPEPPPFVADPPAWLFWAVNVAVALAFFLVLWYVWRRLRPEPDPQSLLVEEAASALAELEAGGDLRDVVLRCYVQMSAVLKENHRMERRQAVTPREFEQQLAAAGMQDEHIRRLTRLFEAVRYGGQSSTGKTAQEASDCLQAIVRTYGAKA